MAIRSFSSESDDRTTNRSIDDDAPRETRQEYIDAVYLLFERLPNGFREKDEQRLHNIVMQSSGKRPSGAPYAGFRHAIGRDLSKLPWQRFYDLLSRIAAEVPDSYKTEYRLLVNHLLAVHRIAWQFGDDDRLHRVLPMLVTNQVEAALNELNQPRFASALASFREALAAYDDHPQRTKEACKNIFDTLESVAKTVGNAPTATFGAVLVEIKKVQPPFLAKETISSLQKLYDLANSHFRHGTTVPFALKPPEVDFFFISCVGATLLFIRL